MSALFSDLAPPRGPLGLTNSDATLLVAGAMIVGALWFVFVRRPPRPPES